LQIENNRQVSKLEQRLEVAERGTGNVAIKKKLQAALYQIRLVKSRIEDQINNDIVDKEDLDDEQLNQFQERYNDNNPRSYNLNPDYFEKSRIDRKRPSSGFRKGFKSNSTISQNGSFGIKDRINTEGNPAKDQSSLNELKQELKDFKELISSQLLNNPKKKEKPRKRSRKERLISSNLDKSRAIKNVTIQLDSYSPLRHNIENYSSSSNSESDRTIRNYSRAIAGKVKEKLSIQHQMSSMAQKQLYQENKKLKELVSAFKIKIASFESEHERIKEESIKLQLKEEAASSRIEKLHQHNDRLVRNNNELESQVKDLSMLLDEERNNRKSKKNKWGKQKEQFIKENEQLRERLLQNQQEKQIYELKMIDLQKTQEEQANTNSILGNEIERLKEELNDINRQALQIQEDSEATRNENTKLKCQAESYIEKIENLTINLSRLNNQLRELEDQKKQESASHRRKKSVVLSKKDREIEELNNQLFQLSEALEEKEQLALEKEAKIEVLHTSLENSKKENSRAKKRSLELEAVIKKLHGTNKELDKANLTIKKLNFDSEVYFNILTL